MSNNLFATVSTRTQGNYKIRKIGVDSNREFFLAEDAPACKFTCILAEPLILTGNTEIHLQSIWIGGYKINISRAVCWDDARSAPINHDVIMYFSIGIPQFDIDSVASEYTDKTDSNGYRDVSGNMNRRFNILNNDKLTIADKILPRDRPIVSETDFEPFTLGHLGRKSFFVSKIKPKTLTKIDIDITDQDGNPIWIDLTGDFDNPPALSRRVIMEFVMVEKMD